MSFQTERQAFEQELDGHYATYPSDLAAVESDLHALSAAQADWLPYTRKAAGYEVMARRCTVKLFRHSPFYHELDVGKARTDLGAGGVGAWMKREPFGQELAAAAVPYWRPVHECGLAQSWLLLDDNHHALGYDNVCRWGLNGLIARAEARLATPGCSAHESAFLRATIAGNCALIAIANRFAGEAERLLAVETDPEVTRRLQRISRTAREVPARPPASFYEALNTILFMREVTQSLEGSGISVFGHLDRTLWPYYQADLASGRTTPAEARDLLGAFLAFSDVRFGMRRAANHVGTNTTVTIGGCDRAGTPVFNDLTRMIIEAYEELKLVDPKLQARLTPRHPAAFFALLARLTAAGSNSLCIFNDDVIIAANHKMGKALADCRLYVGGGCQENVLENTEINSRATIYLNLAQVLLLGFFPQQWAFFAERNGLRWATYAGCASFADFYRACLDNLAAVVNACIAQRNRTEREGWRYNPCPLHSSSLDDCIDKARDMMAGGARYSFGSVSLTGIGTLVDALYAVQQAVYERRAVSLAQLQDMLANDFAGEEAFRQYLLKRVPKFGQEDEGIRAFSARVFADAARVSSGQANSRGGRYEASLFSFRSFTSFGQRTGATPDGRKAGEHLSPGMSPAPLALGPRCGISQMLRALEPLDLTLYPVVAVLDVKLPTGRGTTAPAVIAPILRRFLQAGGSVLQLNCVDQAVLREAREHPERHPDLVVRVSGYSAYFSALSPAIQDEIIARTTGVP
jgi:formate C-acetyltransferase